MVPMREVIRVEKTDNGVVRTIRERALTHKDVTEAVEVFGSSQVILRVDGRPPYTASIGLDADEAEHLAQRILAAAQALRERSGGPQR